MPTLKKVPEKLTWDKAIKRLAENPNDPDPEVQAAKRVMDDFGKIYLPKITEIVYFNNQALDTLKKTMVDINTTYAN